MKQLRLYRVELLLVAMLVAAIAFFGYLGYGLIYTTPSFSGEQAYNYVRRQIEAGPRPTGSEESTRTGDWMTQELAGPEWKVFIQPFTLPNQVNARNIVAVYRHATAGAPVALLGAHYDTRLFADADSTAANRDDPTVGANSNGSGVAVLLELARTLDVEKSEHTVCIVLLDAEDNAGVQGWEGAWGSRFFVQNVAESIPDCADPRFVAVLDSVGSTRSPLAIMGENVALRSALYQVAEVVNFADKFRNEVAPILSPLNEMGAPTVIITDPTYTHRHTLQDTLDKVSAENLRAVGKVLETWLEAGAPF